MSQRAKPTFEQTAGAIQIPGKGDFGELVIRPSDRVRSMIVYGVVSSRTEQAVELFVRREDAESSSRSGNTTRPGADVVSPPQEAAAYINLRQIEAPISLLGYSTAEVSATLGISRRCVGRLRNELRDELERG